jgi:putative dimethyl sulfoxide reductase chaperone
MTASEPMANELADIIAEDAVSLALLHDRELTPDLLTALREARFPTGLGLLPASPPAIAAWHAMADALTELPPDPDAQLIDKLASEYAAIYLTGAHGASPYESVWTSDDHLTCQGAMFELRDIYTAAGLAATDWRQRADDHLVLQLLYVAHAARHAGTTAHWRALARMLDEHLLRWLPDFAARVALRSASPFYAGLAVITVAWLESLRDLLARQCGERRPSKEEIAARLTASINESAQAVVFMPGSGGPSW